MISADQLPSNFIASDKDFTTDHYHELLILAKSKWNFVAYDNIQTEKKCILWRHDVDYSLNRAYKLAQIEKDVGVTATYFINPHSEFYNLAELSQFKLIKEIMTLGHHVGLHFDTLFYSGFTETELNNALKNEVGYFQWLLGVSPKVFSFHNPRAEHFRYQAETYAGLINCYSQRFKSEIPYCSDSNGYWRFKRLKNFLNDSNDKCLQVLTHPGWWQDEVMPPRQRIFRCVYGRAHALMRDYDKALQEHGRLNHGGNSSVLQFLKNYNTQFHEICDYLWNKRFFNTLYLELWREHSMQIKTICMTYLSFKWEIDRGALTKIIENTGAMPDISNVLDVLTEGLYAQVIGVSKKEYESMHRIFEDIGSGGNTLSAGELELNCIYLCGIIERLAKWGVEQSFHDDGLSSLNSKKDPQSPIGDELQESIAARWLDLTRNLPALSGSHIAD